MDNDTSIVYLNSIQINNKRICNSDSQKLLGVSIDKKLRFNDHVSNLCNKAGQKLNALATIPDKIYGENAQYQQKTNTTSERKPLLTTFRREASLSDLSFGLG